MTEEERIKYVVDQVGGRAKCARLLGLRYQAINHWYKNGCVSMACIRSIHRLLPWVSLNWLVFGEGEIRIPEANDKIRRDELRGILNKVTELQTTIKQKIDDDTKRIR